MKKCASSPRGYVMWRAKLLHVCSMVAPSRLNMTISRERLLPASLCHAPVMPRRRFGSCALVGTSGSLLEQPQYGAEIDGSDAVMRLFVPGDNGPFVSSAGARTAVLVDRYSPSSPDMLNYSCPPGATVFLLVIHGRVPWSCATIKRLAGLRFHGCARVFLVRVRDGLIGPVHLGAQSTLDRSWWSTGAAMVLAALGLCNRTRLYGFDPPILNTLNGPMRREAGWWPYHYFDDMYPGAGLDPRNPKKVIVVRERPVHNFRTEYSGFCAMCGKSGVLEYRMPSRLMQPLAGGRDGKRQGLATRCACRVANENAIREARATMRGSISGSRTVHSRATTRHVPSTQVANLGGEISTT